MKTLREKIIEILSDNSEWFENMVIEDLIPVSNYPKIVDKILALGWYPREFVEDAIEDAFTIQEDENNMKYGLWTIQAYKDNIPLKFKTLDELFIYWQNNIKDK